MLVSKKRNTLEANEQINVKSDNIVNSPYFVLFVAGFCIALVSGIVSAILNSRFLDVQPNLGDIASYYSLNIQAYFDFRFNGRLIAIKNALDARNPLWITIPLIFNPELLINRNCHIFIGSLMLFCFLYLLGISVHKRTKSKIYAVACMFAIITAYRFYDPKYGLGGYYTDLQTTYLIGAALLSLMNSDEMKNKKWLLMCGVFIALAQQSRFVSIGVAFTIMGPIILYYFIKKFRAKISTNDILISLFVIVLPIIIISGYSLIRYSIELFNLYFRSPLVSSGVSNMFKSLNDSMRFAFTIFRFHLGTIGYIVLIAFFTLYFLKYWKYRKDISSLLVSFWVSISFILLHIFVLRISNEWVFFNYSLPGLYLLAFIPFEIDTKKLKPANKVNINKLGLFLCSISLIISFIGFKDARSRIEKISTEYMRLFKFQRDVATILFNEVKNYYSAPSEWLKVPTFDAFMEYKNLALGISIFNDFAYQYKKPLRWSFYYVVHKPLWEMTYKKTELSHIKSEVYSRVLNDLDLLIILPDLENKGIGSLVYHPWNKEIITYIYQRCKTDKDNWADEPIAESGIYQNRWGRIHLFRNLKRYKLLHQAI